jgi:hypothetical protein
LVALRTIVASSTYASTRWRVSSGEALSTSTSSNDGSVFSTSAVIARRASCQPP